MYYKSEILFSFLFFITPAAISLWTAFDSLRLAKSEYLWLICAEREGVVCVRPEEKENHSGDELFNVIWRFLRWLLAFASDETATDKIQLSLSIA